jgi:hypothetical protein
MEKKIPTYKIVVNPDDSETGVYAVSLVDQPAIEVDWIKLAKIEELYFSANKDKQMLFGPMLIPNKLIFRRDEKGNEYNIVFDEDTIQTIADKYNENKLGDVFNFQHSDKKVEAVLLQNWITGENDKSKDFGFELPKGTWFGGVKVKDEDFWLTEVKTERVKGFSVEIMAGTELIEMTSEMEDKNKNTKLMEIKTNEGVALYYDGAEVAVGTALFTDEAMTIVAPEGAHMLEDGRVITLDANGVILSIAEETPEIEVEAAEVATPAATDVLAEVMPIFEELRGIMAELSTRLDKLENVETTEEEATTNAENLSKITELENRIELLSSMAGAPSIVKRDDNTMKREAKEAAIVSRIEALKSTKR